MKKTEAKYSLAIHDLKISESVTAMEKINSILNIYNCPLTLHLVFDEALQPGTMLYDFLRKNINNKKIEIVFHGLTHKCSKDVSKCFAFYHKYQAEYLDDTDALRSDTLKMFQDTTKNLGHNIGICPPCWIAHKNNFTFFNTLKPLYVETMLHLHYNGQKIFSPVISLGSSNNTDLFFLKLFGRIICSLSLILGKKRIRVAIHECDFAKPLSMSFFKKVISSLEKRHFQPVLQNELA